jgi:hypothetical protein
MLMFATLRSLRAGLRASASVGLASRLETDGNLDGAMRAAKAGLSGLRAPFVKRKSPSVGSALVCLTAMVEHLSQKTGARGADAVDLQDALAFLRKLGPIEVATDDDIRRWIPFFEFRLSQELDSR